MALNFITTTTNADQTRLDKANAVSFTVQVANQSVYYEINASPFGRGENWVPLGGALLGPGFWTFSPADWAEYGVQTVQGIRFRSVVSTDPGVVTAS
jgi:hypothetical protein